MSIICCEPTHEFLVGHFLSEKGLALRLHKSIERGFNIDELLTNDPMEASPGISSTTSRQSSSTPT